jgi:hypothetical protein
MNINQIYIPPNWINCTDPKQWRMVAEGAGDFEYAFKQLARRLPKLYTPIDTLVKEDGECGKYCGRKTAAKFGAWTDNKAIIKLNAAQWKKAKELWDILDDRPSPVDNVLGSYRNSMPVAMPTRLGIPPSNDRVYACFEGSYIVTASGDMSPEALDSGASQEEIKFAHWADLAYVIALHRTAVFGEWRVQKKKEGPILFRVLEGEAVGAVMCLTELKKGPGLGIQPIPTEAEREQQQRNSNQVKTAIATVP